MITKTAMVTITGRPNVGKSTLINSLVGEKISIVSSKPQTTRNRICAILNHKETQFIFIDTPGYHKPRTKLGDYMVNVVKESVADVDAAILMIEPIPNIGEQEQYLINRIKSLNIPSVLVINKIDTVKKSEILSIIDLYKNTHNFDSIIPICAKSGEGLKELLQALEKYSISGPQLFEDGVITDQPEKQIISEILREKMLILLQREVPHGIAVEITKFSERDDGIIDIDATIYCEKTSHKGIIIGKHGTMLKRIGEMARADMEKFMGTKVFLQTWVKVKENWRDSSGTIRNFGYGSDD